MSQTFAAWIAALVAWVFAAFSLWQARSTLRKWEKSDQKWAEISIESFVMGARAGLRDGLAAAKKDPLVDEEEAVAYAVDQIELRRAFNAASAKRKAETQ